MRLHSPSLWSALGAWCLGLILLSGADLHLYAQGGSAPMRMGLLEVRSSREQGQSWRRHKVLRLGLDTLHLTWDVLEPNGTPLYYKLEHCGADAKPSALEPYEVIEGYAELPLQPSATSQGTALAYDHYQLSLPNSHTAPLRSGLYCLSVYAEGTDEGEPLMRYYYSVVEQAGVQMSGQVQSEDWMGRRTGHHYIDAHITLPQAWAGPRTEELQLMVLHNGQPLPQATALPQPLRPSATQLIYRDGTAIAVPSGGRYSLLEWSRRYSSARGVSHLSASAEGTEMLLEEVQAGGEALSHYQADQDGRYLPYSHEVSQHATQGEYGWAIFRYRSPQLGADELVVLEGEAFDHLPNSVRTLSYQPAQGIYQLRLPVKQGYLEYRYGIASPTSLGISYQRTTGLRWEQDQQYTLLLYYQPIGERAPRLISALEL